MNKFNTQASNYRHGGHTINRPEYNSYRAMKERCYNPNYRRYDLYGGRGIKVCDRWLGREGFPNFLADMGKKPSPKHSIDRIDGEGGYNPQNCCWSTQRQQMSHVSSNRTVTIDGVTDTLTGHSRRYNINLHTVLSRIRQQNWPTEKAFKIPTKGVGSNQTSY